MALLQVHREREEINALPRRGRHDGSGEDDIVAVADGNRPAGLLGEFARFDGKCASCELALDFVNHAVQLSCAFAPEEDGAVSTICVGRVTR